MNKALARGSDHQQQQQQHQNCQNFQNRQNSGRFADYFVICGLDKDVGLEPDRHFDNMAYEVFLGGSCNPTTWRADVAIPTLKNLGITYYNPQVSNWAPDLMAKEYAAKESARILFFVIDDRTRNCAGIIEVAHLAAVRRDSLIVVMHFYKSGQMILGEKISNQEFYELTNGLQVLQYLLERQRVPIFENVSVALSFTTKVVRDSHEIKDEDKMKPRLSFNQLGTDITKLRETFKTLDINDTGNISLAEAIVSLEVFGKSKMSTETRKTVSIECCSEKNEEVVKNVVTEATTDSKEQSVNFDQFCTLADKWNLYLKNNGLNFENWNKTAQSSSEAIDLYVGVDNTNLSWFQSRAVPSIESNGLTYYRPSKTDFNPKYLSLELQKMKNSRVIFLNISELSRGVVFMALAAHLIGLRAKVVLSIQLLPETLDEYSICGEKLTQLALKDYNRGRMYLWDLAEHENVPVYNNNDEALQHVLELLKNGDSLQCTPLDRAYKSKVLGHYPENVPWNNFDEHAVCMLCLPNGLRFRTQKHSVDPNFHSFVLTKEDGHRTYGFSLVFYEECRNRKICAAMQTLQAMFITELSSGQNGVSSHNRKGNDLQNSTRSLPRHFKLQAHSPSAALAYYDSTKDKLFVTKSISLICQQPYLFAAKVFLTNLYKCVPRHPGPGLSLEAYVYNLLYNIPVLTSGKSLKFYVPNDEPAKAPLELIIHQPLLTQELPLLDYSLKDVFSWLGIDCIIHLFTCVLLENQVLIRSTDFHKLMVVTECVTALLLPFSWQHVYVPILPASLYHFLDAPVPFIMGLHAQNDIGLSKITSEANLCYVDLDQQTSQFPEELPNFPHKSQMMEEIRCYLNKTKVPYLEKTDNIFSNCLNGDIMTSSLTLPGSGFQFPRRKHSFHDLLDWDNTDSPYQNNNSKDINVPNELESVEKPVQNKPLDPQDEYKEILIFNNAIREIFLNRFVQIFSNYEQFVILPNQEKEDWLNNRDNMHVFDKATFLSEQPNHHLPFLSRFIETQMFATLVDTKVMSIWNGADSTIKLFDNRISQLKKRVGEGMNRSTKYEICTTITETQRILEHRFDNVDYEVNPPIEIVPHRAAYFRSFPLLDNVALNKEPTQSSRKGQTQWKYKMKALEANGKKVLQQETQSPKPQAKLSADMSPALIAQANWTFVETLLKDVKAKTKRMLVEKMGSEAVALGHGGESVSDVEENTLVASLCDLLERAWSHGLQNKQCRSALWSYLLMYQQLEECNDTSKTIDGSYLSPDLSNLALENDVSPTRNSSNERYRSPSERRNIGHEHLKPLPESLLFDIRNVQAMTDIKTHIGYARAWVRLALEKKLLSRHLKTLLLSTNLLRSQYKRTAFLRCEEEKEQFLYHLLTLNAVDYFCFTNNYPTTKIPYRVIIFPSRKSGASSTTANNWVSISGSLGETNSISVPKGNLEFVFHHKNLGVLSTLRIGHDNSGLSPKWMVEHVVVRNEVTGHLFKFPCGRWLGRGVDDDSTERLLVGALVPKNVDNEELVETCSTPPRCRSPSIPRRPIISPNELQQMLGEAVNKIVKYHYQKDPQDGTLTTLLCGEGGLVQSLEQIFLYGFKNQRTFWKNFFVWDYLVRVKENFELSLLEEMDDYTHRLNKDKRLQAERSLKFSIFRCYCHLLDQINTFSQTLGKDGKFQLFICLATREQLLYPLIRPMSETRSTLEMYEENSFLRNPDLLNFLIQILEPLSDLHLVLEKSLTHGISSLC